DPLSIWYGAAAFQGISMDDWDASFGLHGMSSQWDAEGSQNYTLDPAPGPYYSPDGMPDLATDMARSLFGNSTYLAEDGGAGNGSQLLMDFPPYGSEAHSPSAPPVKAEEPVSPRLPETGQRYSLAEYVLPIL